MADRLGKLGLLLTLQVEQTRQQLLDLEQRQQQLRLRLERTRHEIAACRQRLAQAASGSPGADGGWLLALVPAWRQAQTIGYERMQSAQEVLEQQLSDLQRQMLPLRLALARGRARQDVVERLAGRERQRHRRRRDAAAAVAHFPQEVSDDDP